MTDAMNRVQMAAHHWQPRFVANGIDVNDFEDVLVRTTEWSDWGPTGTRSAPRTRRADAMLNSVAARNRQRTRISALPGATTWGSSSGSRTRRCTPSSAIAPSPCIERRWRISTLPRSVSNSPSRITSSPDICATPWSHNATARAHRSRPRLLEGGDVHDRERVPVPRHGDSEH